MQQTNLDTIESRIAIAQQSAEVGEVYLESAADYQNSARRRRFCILLIILLLIGAIVALSLGFTLPNTKQSK